MDGRRPPQGGNKTRPTGRLVRRPPLCPALVTLHAIAGGDPERLAAAVDTAFGRFRSLEA
nr:hypothetical protein GCM10010200_012570 [Actinomadura rugatobispora]